MSRPEPVNDELLSQYLERAGLGDLERERQARDAETRRRLGW